MHLVKNETYKGFICLKNYYFVKYTGTLYYPEILDLWYEQGYEHITTVNLLGILYES